MIPELTTTHRVVAPDLPGHGASSMADGGLDAAQVTAWLGELIERTCSTPPVLVGQLVGGAIAARFAADRGDQIDRLVLVVPFGLAPFQPTPCVRRRSGRGFSASPSESSHDELWNQCVFDLETLRREPAVRWDLMKDYTLELALTGRVSDALQALMEQFGFEPIPEEMLARVSVPTTLIWGRHDSIVPLSDRRGREHPVRVAAAGDRGRGQRAGDRSAERVSERAAGRAHARAGEERTVRTSAQGLGLVMLAARLLVGRTTARGRADTGDPNEVRAPDAVIEWTKVMEDNRVAGAGPGRPGAIGGDHARRGVRSGQCDHPRL